MNHLRQPARTFATLCGIIAALATIVSICAPSRRAGGFHAIELAALPHYATGDFDGDGRADFAGIQDPNGASRLVVSLSSSASRVDMNVTASSIVQGDIDADGDLDLIAATPAGDLLVFINDGHGHFARHEPAPHRTLSSESSIDDAPMSVFAGVGATSPFVSPDVRHLRRAIASRIRPPTSRVVHPLAFLSFVSLRAPPSAISSQHA